MSLPDGPLVAWLGDDFTGGAAVAETLAFAGLPAAMFLEPPTPDMLSRFPGLRGIGLATTARAESPDWMDAHLPGLEPRGDDDLLRQEPARRAPRGLPEH